MDALRITDGRPNTDYADREMQERIKLTTGLESRGLIAPSHTLENISKEMTGLRADLIKDGIKIQDD